MNSPILSKIKYHNDIQLDYFAQRIKKTMIPVNSPYVLRHVDFLLENSKIQLSDKVLEVGCGMGKFTFPLLERRVNVTGLDLSPFLLTKLLEHNDGRFDVNLIASDVLETPEELDGKFDHVIGFFALHHFHNLPVCFQAMSRLVKPGGKIIFIEPNAWNPLYYLQILFTPGMSFKGDKGVMNMRKSILSKATSYADLTDLKISKYGMLPPFIYNKNWGQWLDRVITSIPFLKNFLAFQLITVIRPSSDGN